VIGWLIAKAATPWVRYLAYGMFGLLVLGVIALRIFNAGQATTNVLARGLEARKAAASVDHSSEAEKHDTYNRDRR
jgi:hypothetical protein